jgi:hypothetical protein
VMELALPERNRHRVGHLPQLCGGLIGIGQRRPGQLDQLPVMLNPVRATRG